MAGLMTTPDHRALPEPRKHFLMTYCECGHVRQDHVDDGPCGFIWEWPGVGLISCSCQAMERMRRLAGEP